MNTTCVNNTYTRCASERLLSPAIVTEVLANMTTSVVVKRTGRTPHIARQAKTGDWDTMQLKDFLILEALAVQELQSKAVLAELIKG